MNPTPPALAGDLESGLRRLKLAAMRRLRALLLRPAGVPHPAPLLAPDLAAGLRRLELAAMRRLPPNC